MDTIRFDSRNTRVIAHRGLSGLERENTASAFVAAGNRSYFGIETDVHRTADGQFVISHDGDTGRVSGVQMDVETSTWDDLRQIVLLDRDGAVGRQDLRLPLLADYIGICRRYEKTSVLELKSDFTEVEIATILGVCGHHLDRVIFISFAYDNLLKVRALAPGQPCQYLTVDSSDGMIRKLAADRLDIDIAHPAVDEGRIRAMHEAGLEVNCWTVDDPNRAAELAAWGVDYLTSNILEGRGA